MSRPIVIQKQKPMRQVLLALTPAFIGSIYFYGWVSAGMVFTSLITCTITEWLFVRSKGGKVSEAVWVTAVLLALICPPTLPFPMLILGGVFAIVFGKMAFGGFGANIFNPAMVGRAFIYITFPIHMTGRWVPAANFSAFPGGFAAWRYSASGDYLSAVTSATASYAMKAGSMTLPGFFKLFFGNINGTFQYLGQKTLIGGGSLGESSAFLLILGGMYLVIKKTAKWRLVLSFFATYFLFTALLHAVDPQSVFDPVFALFTGGAVLGGFFMVTDPVSTVKTQPAQWMYGSFIAIMTVLIRSYSLFYGGLMFAILLGNMFGPLMDFLVRSIQSRGKSA
jgi:Na+-transporting NADH:ubiquinone oxidoreductase subunit B